MLSDYSVKKRYLWDLWFIRDKGRYHVFYLQSRKTKNPEHRHNANVSIGHAVSKNLKKWKELETALKPGKKGAWDGLSLWTGDVVKKGKKYFLFYTGRKDKRDRLWIQKIGLAVSDDLNNWKKYRENPILEADQRYYSMDNRKDKLGKIAAWRDPFVFHENKKWYMLISARKKGKKLYNSCVGLAESDDLINWKTKKPLFAPGRYDEIETPQIVKHNKKYYLFFGVPGENVYAPEWKKKVGFHTAGLHCYYSDKLFGKYRPANGNGIVVEHAENIYDIRLLHKKGNNYFAIGWLNTDKGKFVGKMSAPFEIVIRGNKVFKKD